MEIKLNDYRKITKKEIIKLAYHLESKMLWNQIPWKEHLCNKTLICQTPEDK